MTEPSPRRVLITGGAGFIGVNLVERLDAVGGYAITVLDNESLGDRNLLAPYEIRFIGGDILDPGAVAEAIADVDTVVHLAADTRVIDSIADPDHNFENNVVGTYRLLRAAKDAGVGRFINASTGGAILGEQPPPVHEQMVARPLAPYGASKLAAEGYCSAFAGAYGLATASLRFSNIYGPSSGGKGSVVAHFFKQILAGRELVVDGDGGQVRDYLFVGDLVRGIQSAIESHATGVFQLGRGMPVTLNELIAEIRLVVGSEHPVRVRYEDPRQGEIYSTWCDISNARESLGFAPRTDLKTGLPLTWAWFRQVFGNV